MAVLVASTLSLRRRDSNLCISKSDVLNFTVQTGSWAARLRLFFKRAARALAIRDAQVRVLPLGESVGEFQF